MNHQNFGDLAKKFLYFQKKAAKESIFILLAFYLLVFSLNYKFPDILSFKMIILIPPIATLLILLISGLLTLIND